MGCNPQNQSKHLFSANEHCAKNSEESVDKNKKHGNHGQFLFLID
jgi:hypothetical protein